VDARITSSLADAAAAASQKRTTRCVAMYIIRGYYFNILYDIIYLPIFIRVHVVCVCVCVCACFGTIITSSFAVWEFNRTYITCLRIVRECVGILLTI